jgi:hypothetical protein
MLDLGSHKVVGKRSVLTWKVRHNLDVMHMEKNICESLMATILNILRKTKDIIKARLDLKDLGIKKCMQFRESGDSC